MNDPSTVVFSLPVRMHSTDIKVSPFEYDTLFYEGMKRLLIEKMDNITIHNIKKDKILCKDVIRCKKYDRSKLPFLPTEISIDTCHD